MVTVTTIYFRVLLMISVSLISFLLNSCSFTSRKSAKLLSESRNKQYDIIVVPGVPLENGKWSAVMKARVYWSKYLIDAGITENVMYSGSAVHSPYVESAVMAHYGAAIGIPPDKIFTESDAEHSTENVYYSFHKARKLGFRKIALASDPFQTKMLQRFTRKKVSDEVDLIPIVYDTLRQHFPVMQDPHIDTSNYFIPDFTPLAQREGFWLRLRGTLGKSINSKIQ